MALPVGLRERKKQATRERIVGAGMRLFAERGFDGTTIADLAAEADISPRTFFAYFPSKEDVVFHDADAKLEQVRGWMRDREPGTNVIDAIAAGAEDLPLDKGADEAGERARRRLIESTPSLQAHSDHLRSRFADVIAEGVAEEFGESPDDLRPRLVAATTLAAIALLDDSIHADETAAGAAACAPDELVTTALTFLRGGLAALQDAQRPIRLTARG